MKKILILFSIFLLLVACGKNKEQIVDKCLLQANQTFPDAMKWKIDHFENCMLGNHYLFRDSALCNHEDPIYALSSICYSKD
jgi:hypothetical protein